MRFDTRDKKPKLRVLLLLTVLAVAALAAVFLRGGERSAVPAVVVMDVYLAAALALLFVAFFRQLQYNLYSYNTIFYAGFALFVLSVLLAHLLITPAVLRDPVPYQGAGILSFLTNSAGTYMLLSFPFLLVFSAALCVSNAVLLRREGRSFVNVLGIVLAVLVVGGALLYWRMNYYASGSQREVMIHDLVCNTLAAVYLYFECMILGTIVADVISARREPEPDRDFVIILGCGLRPDGTPTPLLQGRIDRAIAFAQKQLSATGKELTFVTSGGQGPDEVVSESASMKRYLLDHGIPADRIIEEDRSTNTFENMAFSREKIMEIDPAAKVAFSTTNYHVFRSGVFARRLKMRAAGMGAGTRWYFWPNAAAREFVGLLTEHRGKQLIILCGLILGYIALTLLLYR